MTQPPDPRFYSEKRLAEILGLPREKLRDIRTIGLELSDPAEFATFKREIAYTPAGVAKLIEYLRASGAGEFPVELDAFTSGAGDLGVPEKKPAPDPADVALLKVRKVCPNRHLLEALTEAGDHVRVWVPDNGKFVPKMELSARLREGQTAFYNLVGNCPRRKGRY